MPRKTAKSDALSVSDTEPVVTAPPAKKSKAPAKPRVKKSAPPAVLSSAAVVEPTTDQVAEEAYLLWLSEGQPAGRDLEHWLLAEQIVRSRLSLLSAAVHSA
ncbi:hypothetical protein CHU95_01495 [Niveispirillum lacus]|uniref:DUF2934 domain-containing protein n=1 Tax=Niveispirillum lacus TaxID=1981099 RepID=A0A255Z935_9PROT|nr:DUF2934 domain-containing protein [Niveispirillum lacus]OYQ37395.1 hypothetical protein CHU95_01495 [Niveispirillum lacus]